MFEPKVTASHLDSTRLGSVDVSTSFPLYRTNQTSTVATATSVSCPQPDSCTAAKAPCGITSSARAGNAAHRLSRRGGAGGVPRRPRRGACPHHRVETHWRQSAGRWRRPCREATAAVLRHGSPFRDHSCVCPAPGIGTQAAAARPTGLPIRILHLSPAAHLYLSPDDAVSRISASRSRAFWSFDC